MSSLPATLVQFRTDLEDAISREQTARLRQRRRRRRVVVAIAMATLVCVLLVTPALGIGGRLLDLIQGSPAAPLEVQTLAWSPDGRRISFVSRGGTYDVYVMNADGSGQRKLARDARLATPAWSPDGRMIAFERRDGFNRLYVVNADGSGLRNLADANGQPLSPPTWSPDGRKLAFVNSGGVFVINADGSGQRPLTRRQRAGRSASPAWSPDGRKIAFVHDGGCGDFCFHLYVMNADGSALRNLTRKLCHSGCGPGGGPASHPAWSPDGLKIAFDNDHDGEVYVMNADGSRLRRLTRKSKITLKRNPDG